MHRTRLFAPTPALNRKRLERAAGLAALAALSCFFTPAARAQTVTITDLSPAGYTDPSVNAFSSSTQVGEGNRPASNGYMYPHALLWHGTAGSVVDLNPKKSQYSVASGVSGDTQVGYDYNNFHSRALLWHGTAASIVNLGSNNAGDGSVASGVDGSTQVGTIFSEDPETGTYGNKAVLWHGTANSLVSLNPASTNPKAYGKGSDCSAISGDTQVGLAYDILGYSEEGYEDDSPTHAFLWHGTAASAVDLNPAGFEVSYAYGVSGSTQVGSGYLLSQNFQDTRALLWHGTAKSAVDLHPDGYNVSAAYGAAGDVQVGYGRIDGNGSSFNHALLWQGTAASAVDLNQFLPAGFTDARAYNVSGSNGVYDVVGTAFSTEAHAIVWHVVFASAARPVIAHLYPASRTVGRDAFTLTVTGSGFTAASKVQWNGAAQTTTFVNSTTLTASIPAALIATAGAASVTVNTPGVGTSNSHIETIMPRPTISSLSPASMKAGSGMFTLTVTGTGFRPASFYAPTVVKWNGLELATTYVSETKMTAQVPATLTAHTGTATVTVTTPQVAMSAGKTFIVTP